MTERLGDYELERHLATGGMAEIFVGRRADAPDQKIALKCILPHLAREERFISMFLDEARIAARLQHPNIVEIYELGEENGEYFIAMEYLDGGDLADLLDVADERQVVVPIAVSVRIIADILSALDYAHDYAQDGKPMRIVHRDVSPHNVLIGSNGKIKLVDFGIAHAVERHAKTETGLVKGKLSYMSPEQVEQRGLDRRADIFSAGALLYELLVGQPPFGRELAAVNAILNEPTPNPQLLRPEVPDELVAVLERALVKDPDLRYSTAREMADDLEAVLTAYDVEVTGDDVARFAAALTEGVDFGALPELRRSDTALVSTSQLHSAPDGTRAKATAPIAPTLTADAAPFVPSKQPSPARYFAVAALMLVCAGATIAVVGTTRSVAEVPTQRDEPTPQVVEQTVRAEPEAIGFEFDASEVELAQLEAWVDTLDAQQLDRMLAIHFERADEDLLWSVWGPELAREFGGPEEPINPGDPAAVSRLGELVDAPVATTRRQRRTKRRPSPPAVAKTDPAATPVAVTATTPPATNVARPKAAPKKPKKKKNDLRIIDRAVPY